MRHELGSNQLWFVALEFVLAILDARDQRLAKPGFFADLPDGTADPIHVVRSRGLRMLFHPGEQIGVGCEALAARKNLTQARRRKPHHVGEQVVGGPIAIAQERQQDGKVGNRSASLLEIVQRRVVQDHEAREVEILEVAERNDRVVPPRHARAVVHRGQQRPQPVHAPVDNRRDHHEV